MSESNGARSPVWLLYNVDSTWTPEDAVDCMHHVERMAEALRGAGHAVEPVEVRQDIVAPLRGRDPREAVIFNWCEGLDGQPNAYDLVARTLDDFGFAYTGSGPWALQHTQNKADFKTVLDALDIATPRWRVFADTRAIEQWTIFPAIVKPVAEHCSYGITADSVVDDAAGLRRQIEFVMDKFGVGALVEEFIVGREVNASIWGNGSPYVLPLYEIEFPDIDDPRRQVVDFDAKWTLDSFQYTHTPSRCPADLDAQTAARARGTALAAYRAMRCRDYGRIDLRLRDGVAYVIDVNANCDITIDGGFAKTAKVAGYDYGAMASQIVSWASARRPM
jgi:D-alanine-D-alanine ligase